MIPSMPDLSASLAAHAAGGGALQIAPTPGTPPTPTPGTGGLDFAGMLDAAMPSSPAPYSTLLTAGPDTLPLAALDPGPGGKTVPVSAAQPGEELPPAVPPPVPLAEAAPQPLPVHLALARTVSRRSDLAPPEAQPAAPADAATRPDADPAKAAVTGGLAAEAPRAVAETETLTEQAAPDPVPAAVFAPVPQPPAPLTLAPTTGPLLAATPLPPPTTPPIAPHAAGNTQASGAARVLAAATPPSGRSPTGAPPAAPGEDSAASAPPAEPAAAPAPALAALPVEPASSAPAAPAPGTPVALPPPAPQLAMPERIEAPRAPAPQQETAIAQVGDLREALRSARPEMTLRHAEFGQVSLRLEATGTADWRAVLASRDPGFVPAIQAALAERAVAAASASADTGAFMGQNGTSEQRYGASPNGGQAGLSPYLGQSGGRDGEAAPDHRRTSTAAALAARAEGDEDHGSQTGHQSRGMFA